MFRTLKLFATVLGLALSANTHAALSWSWSFDQPSVVTTSGEIISMDATLRNHADSTETFFGSALNGAIFYFGELWLWDDRYYGWEFDSAQFDDIELAPGEEAAFSFGLLIPLMEIPEGFYMSQAQGLFITDENWNTETVFALVALSVTIVDDPADVPEPANILLLGTAGLAMALSRRAKRWKRPAC